MPDNQEPTTLDTKGTEAALTAAAQRLQAEFSDIDRPEVDRVLRASFEQVAVDATVASFLPLFAERRSRLALRESQAA